MDIRFHRGLITVKALERENVPMHEIEAALSTGSLRPVVPGLAATASVGPAQVEAIIERWIPTCISAAEAQGLFVPPRSERKLHAYKLRTPKSDAMPGVVPHGWEHRRPESEMIASVPLLLRHAVWCLDLETCLVLAESALQKKLLTFDEWRDVVDGARVRDRRVLSRAAETSHAGGETRVRLAFEAQRIPVQAQAYIEGVGHVDLLVNGRMVVECDSRAHHSAPRDAAEDRRRDLVLHELGYVVVRLNYDQIWRQWDRTWEVLLAKYRDLRRRERRPLAV